MCGSCWSRVPAHLQCDVLRTYRAWRKNVGDAERGRPVNGPTMPPELRGSRCDYVLDDDYNIWDVRAETLFMPAPYTVPIASAHAFLMGELPPASPTLDEALAFIRAEGARHLDEARAEQRLVAKQTWRDLGMSRPADQQDYAEAFARVSVAITPVVAHIKRVMQAALSALKPLIRDLQDAGVLDEHGNLTTTEKDHP